MLHEIAIAPNVFLACGYSSPEVCDAHMQGLRQPLLEWCMVLDLCEGEWVQFLDGSRGEMPNQAKELWKRLLKRNRICAVAKVGEGTPSSDQEWCQEALDHHQHNSILGVLACAESKRAFRHEPLVASVERRSAADWWQNLEAGHPDGPTSKRRLENYKSRMAPILTHARSLLFLDPHLDPAKRNYSTFLEMIEIALDRSSPKPRIQIHRCCYEGSGENRRIIDGTEWEQRFQRAWSTALQAKGASIEVFIWSDAHDRHLLSDLIGVHVGNGFDTSNDANKTVSWTRLSSRARDEMQRSVDPSVHQNALKHRFQIP